MTLHALEFAFEDLGQLISMLNVTNDFTAVKRKKATSHPVFQSLSTFNIYVGRPYIASNFIYARKAS